MTPSPSLQETTEKADSPPSWWLEEVTARDVRPAATWRVTVTLSNEIIGALLGNTDLPAVAASRSTVEDTIASSRATASRVCVDVRDDEIRLVTSGEPGSLPFSHLRWRLSVPERARPVGKTPWCKVSRRRSVLTVEWPQGEKGDGLSPPRTLGVAATSRVVRCNGGNGVAVVESAGSSGAVAEPMLKVASDARGFVTVEPTSNATPASIAATSTEGSAIAPGTQGSSGHPSISFSASSPSPQSASSPGETVVASSTPAAPSEAAASSARTAPAATAPQMTPAMPMTIGPEIPEVVAAESEAPATDSTSNERAEAVPSASTCQMCGSPAKLCCSRCHSEWYCGSSCQRRHWSSDHRPRCPLTSRLVSAEMQRRRGDAELALMNLEELLKDTSKVIRSETEKEMTYDGAVVAALLRHFAAVAVALAAAMSDDSVAPGKFCRAAFVSVAVFMDIAANMGEKRRPAELQVHVDDIVSGCSAGLRDGADPVLSAWVFYDEYAKSFESRPSRYQKKIPKLRAGCIVAFRDVLAAAHDLLEIAAGFADKRAADRVDKLLDNEKLKLSSTDFGHLRPYWTAPKSRPASARDGEDSE